MRESWSGVYLSYYSFSGARSQPSAQYHRARAKTIAREAEARFFSTKSSVTERLPGKPESRATRAQSKAHTTTGEAFNTLIRGSLRGEQKPWVFRVP